MWLLKLPAYKILKNPFCGSWLEERRKQEGIRFVIPMNNTGQIIRSKKNGTIGYTPISNEILQSKVLTPNQKSILVHLLSLPQDWIVYKLTIWREMNLGREAFNAAWKGLVELGYITSNRIIDPETHRIIGYNHIVFEDPLTVSPETGTMENTGTRLSGKPVDIQIKQEQKTEEQKNLEEKNDTGPIILGEIDLEDISSSDADGTEFILSKKELRSILNELFIDYPGWETDLYRLELSNFLIKTRSYYTGEPRCMDLIREFYEL